MILEDLTTFLVAALPSDSITYGQMPDEPDNAITLYEYAGSPPLRTHDGKKLLRPSVQVMVRGKDYKVARQKLEAIEALFEAVVNQTIGAAYYTRIFAIQSAFPLPGWKDNYVWLAQNFGVELEG